MPDTPKALYLHIPFCTHLCSYCDFPKVLLSSADPKAYLSELEKEILSLKIPEDSLSTIYIGGGTPSALTIEELEDLLSFLHSHFPSVEEFSMEANPDSLTEDKISILGKYGVNRVSLGVQSVNPKLLALLMRHHTKEEVKDAVWNLKKHGITNINLDFIYGIPGMKKDDVLDDIDFALSLKPTHLSFYSLQIEDGTLFGVRHVKAEEDDTLADQYELINKKLEERSYHRYEVSNFALPGFECKHNLTYWHDETYYAAGLGASGYIGNRRYTNTRSLTHYLQGKHVNEEEIITPLDHEFEFLMLNLRLCKGFSLSKYSSLFGFDFYKRYQKSLSSAGEDLVEKGGFIAIKPEKLYTMDGTLLTLLQDLPDKDERRPQD